METSKNSIGCALNLNREEVLICELVDTNDKLSREEIAKLAPSDKNKQLLIYLLH
jgi:hypothetical protein